MVGTSIDRRHAINTLSKTTSDWHLQHSIRSRLVDPLEERKLQGIGHRCLLQARHLFNHDMGMPNDRPCAVNLTGCSIVVGCGGDKVASNHVVDGH